MGVVLMSKRELNRIDVLARLDGRRLTTSAAADLMRVTPRQTHRLLKRYRDGVPNSPASQAGQSLRPSRSTENIDTLSQNKLAGLLWSCRSRLASLPSPPCPWIKHIRNRRWRAFDARFAPQERSKCHAG